MGKNKGSIGSEYSFKQGYENSFISDVIETYNGISDTELKAQIDAIKNVMIHIKKAYEEGLEYVDIDDRILYNMSNLFSIIKYPNLTNFYQLRTLEYMMDLDLEPYVIELLNDGFDLNKYHKLYRNRYSANVEKNVIIELYGMVNDFLEAEIHTSAAEFYILSEKAKNGRLTIKDKDLLLKYVKMYLKELKIGKSVFWNEQKKDLEACRKMLFKHKEDLFDVKILDFKTHLGEDKDVEDKESKEPRVAAENISLIKPNANIDQKNIMNDIASMNQSKADGPVKQVSLKDCTKIPFISEDKENNFLIIISEALRRFSDIHLSKFYEVLIASESGKSQFVKDKAKATIYDFFAKIGFEKNLLHAREYLMERLAVLMTFYKASGCLREYCDINNNRLNRIYLGDLQVEEDQIFSKFINNPENGDYYFVDNTMDYERAYKETPLSYASDEAIIGMSAFYSNRMTKAAQSYSMLGFIIDKLCIIERIGENRELTYEDLDVSEDDICMYMSIYKCFQKLMIKNYFQNVDQTKPQCEEDVHKRISEALAKYKGVYEKAYPELGLSFERDIDYIMMDAQIIDEMYALKSFAVKSLLYTAITDKKKNIINWGFVPEDENESDKFALLGFDIKSLNAPLFVHMKYSDLVAFIRELTGDSKIRVYEGAGDMYNYSIKQRVTTQILYPLSKDEKKKLSKVKGTGALTNYYLHVRWLQQPNNPPVFSHKPGSREFDLKTKTISTVKKADIESAGGKKDGKKSKEKTDR